MGTVTVSEDVSTYQPCALWHRLNSRFDQAELPAHSYSDEVNTLIKIYFVGKQTERAINNICSAN